jgi:ketosteroid isomerase-like protein
MTQSEAATDAAGWEPEIRALEEQARVAFLNGDVETLEELWADAYVVNSPLDRVHRKTQVLDLLQAGRIRHSTYECEIEHISRYGDVVIVMGHDRVTGPPAGDARRRYTNVWQLDNGRWRSIARHAHVVSRGATG